tara:strand:- start:128 stop:253 length:126 start_codon:yes stop_codon:yes gene_type:complete
MKTIKNFLWNNAAAIFCYAVATLIFVGIVAMDLFGIIKITM